MNMEKIRSLINVNDKVSTIVDTIVEISTIVREDDGMKTAAKNIAAEAAGRKAALDKRQGEQNCLEAILLGADRACIAACTAITEFESVQTGHIQHLKFLQAAHEAGVLEELSSSEPVLSLLADLEFATVWDEYASLIDTYDDARVVHEGAAREYEAKRSEREMAEKEWVSAMLADDIIKFLRSARFSRPGERRSRVKTEFVNATLKDKVKVTGKVVDDVFVGAVSLDGVKTEISIPCAISQLCDTGGNGHSAPVRAELKTAIIDIVGDEIDESASKRVDSFISNLAAKYAPVAETETEPVAEAETETE